MTQTQEKIDTFFRQFPTSTYPKNQVIVATDQPLNYFYYIESGAVKMSCISSEGKNLVLHIFFPKAFFSLLTLIQDSNHYDFTTLVPTIVRKVPKTELITFLQTHNDVLYELQLRLLSGMSGLLNRIEKTTFISAYKQVISLLLYFSRHFSKTDAALSESKIIKVRITHQDIAEWLGLSRENVSLQMKRLEHDGLIRKKDTFLEIIDLPKMEKLADPFGLI